MHIAPVDPAQLDDVARFAAALNAAPNVNTTNVATIRLYEGFERRRSLRAFRGPAPATLRRV